MTDQPTARLSVRNLSCSYGENLALVDVSLELPAGKLVVLLGPNGSGKSTLIRAILGLVRVTRGTVAIDGAPVRRRELAYVPQRENVNWDFPVSVADVTMMGRYSLIGWFRRPGRSDWIAVDAALDEVGMRQFRDRQIGELSGGQQQRVFIARALAQQARILLLDEPLASVDPASEALIVTILRRLADDGRLILMAAHDLGLARAIADWVIFLNRRVVASGPPGEVFTPEVLRSVYGATLLRIDGELGEIGIVGDEAHRHPAKSIGSTARTDSGSHQHPRKGHG